MRLPDLIPMTINSKNFKAYIEKISALILLLQMAHLAKLIKGIKKGKKDVDKRDRGVVYYQGTHERVQRTLKIKQRRNKQGKKYP